MSGTTIKFLPLLSLSKKRYAFSHCLPSLLPLLHLFRTPQHITYMILLELLNTPGGQHSHAYVPILPRKKPMVKEKL